MFPPGARFVKFCWATLRPLASATTVEFSVSFPMFLTMMVMLMFDPMVADLVDGETEYTIRLCGEVVVVTTIVIVIMWVIEPVAARAVSSSV